MLESLLFFRLGLRIELGLKHLSQARKHHGFELGIARTGLPNRALFLTPLEHFHHLAVRDEDVRRAVFSAFHAGAVLITRAGVVNDVQRFTDGGTNDVLREIGLVFGPFRLDDAGLGILVLHSEADACPEVLQQGPDSIRRDRHVNITELTVAHNLGVIGFRQNLGGLIAASFRIHASLGRFGIGTHNLGTGRNRKTIVVRHGVEIRRHFQRSTRRRGFILNLFIAEVNPERITSGQSCNCRNNSRSPQSTIHHKSVLSLNNARSSSLT